MKSASANYSMVPAVPFFAFGLFADTMEIQVPNEYIITGKRPTTNVPRASAVVFLQGNQNITQGVVRDLLRDTIYSLYIYSVYI